MVGCPDSDTVAAWLSRALPEAACELLANHAASCERCHVLVDLVFDHADHSALRTDEAVAASRADFDALDRGTLVGRYRIAEHLGGGGMGVVYAAEDTELRRRVAVKLLRSALRPAAPEGERMLREARTLARLSHPNVVTVFDVGTHEGRPFIAMELVDGGSLNQWLRTAERTLDDRLDRMLEAARGLAAAHAAGVVHRDVKPENILVGGGRSRVTDFGLANSDPSGAVHPGLFSEPGSLTRTGTVMGTPAYMAPEQLVGRTVDPRSDQWSFCATLYEVVAGTRPFADDPAARSIAIGEGRLADPVPPRAVPPWLRKIIARGVRPLPSERWPSMDAIVDALARGRRRRRTAWSVVIAVTAAVTVGAATAARRPTPAAQAMPPRASDQERWHDSRPGCDCPYSACAGGCTSICSASAFPDETPVPGINGATSQEALLGASRDGRTLLYLTGERCAIDRLMLARRRGETFETFELTGQLDLDHVSVFEGCCTLSPDGASVIIATKDRKAFVRSRLDGAHLGPLERDEFARLRPRDGD